MNSNCLLIQFSQVFWCIFEWDLVVLWVHNTSFPNCSIYSNFWILPNFFDLRCEWAFHWSPMNTIFCWQEDLFSEKMDPRMITNANKLEKKKGKFWWFFFIHFDYLVLVILELDHSKLFWVHFLWIFAFFFFFFLF